MTQDLFTSRRKIWEGASITLAPFALALTSFGAQHELPYLWHVVLAAGIACCGMIGSYLLFHRHTGGRLLCWIFLFGLPLLARTLILANPFAALFFGTLVISGCFGLADFNTKTPDAPFRDEAEPERLRAWGSSLAVFCISVLSLFSPFYGSWVDRVGFCIAGVCAALFLIRWGWHLRTESRWGRFAILIGCVFLLLLGGGLWGNLSRILLFVEGGCFLILLLCRRPRSHAGERGWDIFLLHPARSLLTTFLGLSLLGTLLLCTPVATFNGISVMDAAFTAVSACCVTGLAVVDIPSTFTGAGQFFILLLIQLGGLGIMSIATIALHVIGKLSLNQEWVMTQVTDTADRSLVDSLALILRFTFAVELTGAVILAFWFFTEHEMTLGRALWHGVFSAISAFCNAGLTLNPDSLMSYQGDPLVLHVIALLIILGGTAPAACLFFPRFVVGRSVPLAVELAFVSTLVLLFAGTVALLIFEWNGVFNGLTFWEKINNAWFQSATMRTAGFNSVDIALFRNPSYLLTLIWMFIGGCPGGTAGGIKTTTVAVLALTFWANVTGRNEIVVRNRRIRHTTVYRAVTILLAALLVLSGIILMLLVTQSISAKALIFEAISALATVGLSAGATTHLDGIGKSIIILAMFIGRIGPMTIFMLLNDSHPNPDSHCPEARIILS